MRGRGATRETPSCIAGGTHTARYESYERIRRNTAQNSWEVTARDGTVSIYKALASLAPAGTEDARLRNDYRWLLQAIIDTDGNTITYSYDCAALPTCYASTISYGASTVQFFWESRADTFTHATGVSLANVTKRLKSVAVNNGTSLIRAYAVGYTVSPDTKRSLLASFKQHGSDATINASTGAIVGGISIPADSFTYWDMSSRRMGTMVSDRVTANTAVEAPSPPSELALIGNRVQPNGAKYLDADFDGDQRTDTMNVVSRPMVFYRSGGTAGQYEGLGGGQNVTSPTNANPIGYNAVGGDFITGDFNGDGKQDFARISPLGTVADANVREPYRSSLVSSGFGTTSTIVSAVYMDGSGVLSGSVTGISGGTLGDVRDIVVADFNGDGRDDIRGSKLLISTGAGFSQQDWGSNIQGPVGDFNGDGLADILMLNGDVGSKLLLSTGSSFVQMPANLALGYSYASTANRTFRVRDLNGDGISDVISPSIGTSSGFRLSNGSAFEPAGHSCCAQQLSGLYDSNGDGRIDFTFYSSGVIMGGGHFERYDINVTVGDQFSPWREGGPQSNQGDFNGDGLFDGGGVNTPSVLPDLMKRHTIQSGGTVDVEFLPSSYWQNGYMPMVAQTVSKVITSDGEQHQDQVRL